MNLVEKTRRIIWEEVDRRFQAKQYEIISQEELAEIELVVKGGIINLFITDWDKTGTYVIQYELRWSKELFDENVLIELYKLLIILKELYVITGEPAIVDYFESQDGEDIDIEIQYFRQLDKVEDILAVIDGFSKVDLTKNHLDKPFIEKNYPQIFELFTRRSQECRKELQFIIQSPLYNEICYYEAGKYRPVVSEIFAEEDYVYTTYNQKLYVGFTQEGIQRYIEKYGLDLKPLPVHYTGVRYHIMTEASGAYVVWDSELWKEALRLVNLLRLNDPILPVQATYGKGHILIRVGEFWVCIMAEMNGIKEKLLEEQKALQRMERAYLRYTKEGRLPSEYDLYQLSPEEFEGMCCDLLYAEGYEAVKKRGTAYAADGGVDIEATEWVRGIHTQEEKKWIFQCKRTKRLDVRDLMGIEYAMREFEADRYGLFYAGILTPKLWDKCKAFEKNRVWIFDQNWIKQKLKEHEDVAKKYFGFIQ
ncbi:MAG: restriction endonuclease [Firmicutes bacterium]|jgi:hypothetical protein|nr:restriction endonuclease [Bacillota bacterium]